MREKTCTFNPQKSRRAKGLRERQKEREHRHIQSSKIWWRKWEKFRPKNKLAQTGMAQVGSSRYIWLLILIFLIFSDESGNMLDLL